MYTEFTIMVLHCAFTLAFFGTDSISESAVWHLGWSTFTFGPVEVAVGSTRTGPADFSPSVVLVGPDVVFLIGSGGDLRVMSEFAHSTGRITVSRFIVVTTVIPEADIRPSVVSVRLNVIFWMSASELTATMASLVGPITVSGFHIMSTSQKKTVQITMSHPR
ncbi:hypothetical protein IW262DRAFT_1371993 [Armillaria fumosa]|nr:hypothetical protein IW262DRAFT_1371993 [Armillaria fumosa]